MTPFGALLRYFREDRGISQHEMGRRLAEDSKLVSAIETGRRRPPKGEKLRRIRDVLLLSEAEFNQLSEAAEHSGYTLKIPREISPRRLQLAHRLVNSLGGLQQDQLTAIQAILERRS